MSDPIHIYTLAHGVRPTLNFCYGARPENPRTCLDLTTPIVSHQELLVERGTWKNGTRAEIVESDDFCQRCALIFGVMMANKFKTLGEARRFLGSQEKNSK